jgi:hypothetical protein
MLCVGCAEWYCATTDSGGKRRGVVHRIRIGHKTGRETRGVQKAPYHDAEGLIESYYSTILRGSVGAGWFDNIVIFETRFRKFLNG